MLKTIEDCLRKLNDEEDIAYIINNQKKFIVEVLCIGSENDEIMIKN